MYKLVEHLLNGGGSATLGIGYGLISEPVKIVLDTDPIPDGYRDISSIKYWYQFGEQLGLDFLLTKEVILRCVHKKALEWLETNAEDKRDIESIGYSLCTLLEKEILAKLYIASPQDHLQDFSVEDFKEFRNNYHTKATATRFERIKLAETLIDKELPLTKGIVILDLTSQLISIGSKQYCIDFHKSYKEFGSVGSVEDYHPIKNPNPGVGLLDYFNSRSLFKGKGFLDYSWTPLTLSMQELANKVSLILTTGKSEDSIL
ncbi:MAG: hypothetical protein ACRC80_26645 [Waterburya sp.]